MHMANGLKLKVWVCTYLFSVLKCTYCSKTVLKGSAVSSLILIWKLRDRGGHSVLVRSADVPAAQGCSCDSFTWTVCTFKNRKRICTYFFIGPQGPDLSNSV